MNRRNKNLSFISVIVVIIAGISTIIFTAHNTYATKEERALGDQMNTITMENIKSLIETQNGNITEIRKDIKTILFNMK